MGRETTERSTSHWFTHPYGSVDEFEHCLTQFSTMPPPRNAQTIQRGVPVYDAPELRNKFSGQGGWRTLLDEWIDVLKNGAGVLIIKKSFEDTAIVDEATNVFRSIIAEERQQKETGDHFAKAGENDRIWNALEKLCLNAPEVFTRYYSNDMIALVSEAWLGPNYQMTSQVNVVRPGGSAQQAHRDYHLGFGTVEQAEKYPRHVHQLTMALTLQGGVAHCDIPVESGPTRLLPFSQNFEPGYLTYRREDFQQVFEDRFVSLPLEKGDTLFFNPALYHAAGSNTTSDVQRMVNLLQVSSAFGHPMETVNRLAMCKRLYAGLLAEVNARALTNVEARRALACAAGGYAFPTNLDTDPPVGGLAPQTQYELIVHSLGQQRPPEEVATLLDQQAERRKA